MRGGCTSISAISSVISIVPDLSTSYNSNFWRTNVSFCRACAIMAFTCADFICASDAMENASILR